MADGKNVVIVGAGVIGLAAGYELLKAGHQVTILERDVYGCGASHGNAALVTEVASFPVPAPGTIPVAAKSLVRSGLPITLVPRWELGYADFLLRMAFATRKEAFAKGTAAQELFSTRIFADYDAYLADGLAFEHHQFGSLELYEDPARYRAAVAQFDGFPALRSRIELVEGTEAMHEYDPALADWASWGYVAAKDRQVEPRSLMTALAGAIAERGGRLVEHAEVVAFTRKSGRVTHVASTAGYHPADVVVIAAGTGSRALAAKLGFRLPLYSGGGYSIDVHLDADAPKPRGTVLTAGSHIAVTPLDWGLRTSSGMLIGQPEPVVIPALIEKLKRDFTDLYPGISLEGAQPAWAGHRPMSADGIPVIGPIPGNSNALLATGHAMLGLTYAPTTAKALAALVTAESQPPDSPFSPARF